MDGSGSNFVVRVGQDGRLLVVTGGLGREEALALENPGACLVALTGCRMGPEEFAKLAMDSPKEAAEFFNSR